MIRVLFSTSRGVIPALIRFCTRSKVSHVAITYLDPTLDEWMVLEASSRGFFPIPTDLWERENRVVRCIDVQGDLLKALRAVGKEIGASYDYPGLLGMSVVLVGRLFKRKWKNPFQSPRELYCTEATTRLLQGGDVIAALNVDPETTTPQDLLQLLSSGAN